MTSFSMDEMDGTSATMEHHGDILPEATAFTFQQRYAAPEDWKAHSDVIQNLYLTQRKPLREVMKIMERKYNFHATSVV